MVGALGPRRLRNGWYAYTGSALGAGGFSRVDRHRRVAAGEYDVRHWHVDYLLDHDDAALQDVVRAPSLRLRRAPTRFARRDAVARALPDGPVDGFGASDCGARLAYAADEAELRRRIDAAYSDP